MKMMGLIALTVALAACGGQAGPSAPASGAAPGRASGPSASAASISAGATPGASQAAPTATAARADLAFGKPVLIAVGDRELPAVLVTNTSDQVQSFTVAATWMKDGHVVAAASGAVMDLRPHEQRAVNLANPNPIPADADSAEAHVDRLLSRQPNDPNAAIAARIQFGKPVVQHGAISNIEVPATNQDSASHSLSVGAALLAHGTLMATAFGMLGNIGPHTTLPVMLAIAGEDSGYDQILVYVNSVTS